MNNKSNMVLFWSNKPEDTGYLSQWYPSKFVDEKGNQYHCAEQYMMAEKAALFKDTDTYEKIMKSDSPKEIQKLGREVKKFDQVIWDAMKSKIVEKGNYLKFSQNNKLKEQLMNTAPAVLAEASPYDIVWGIGWRAADEQARNKDEWRGENRLGYALMAVRDKLMDDYANRKE